MDNRIEMDNIDDLKNEKAAVAMLLTQAAQAMGDAAPTPAPEPSEPVGDEDFNGLLEKQKALANKLQGLRKQETELLARLQSVRDEAVALENQSRVIKEKAQVLFVTIFGLERPAPQIEQPESTPRAAGSAASRKPDNSIVPDKTVPITVLPADAPPEARQVVAIPSLNF